MDEFVIQTVSASEPASTSDSSDINSLQLVPDPEAGRFISVTFCCKNNMFLIEDKNSFDGVVYGAGDGALKSRKQDIHRHGWDFKISCGARINIWAAPIIPAVTRRLRWLLYCRKAENPIVFMFFALLGIMYDSSRSLQQMLPDSIHQTLNESAV